MPGYDVETNKWFGDKQLLVLHDRGGQSIPELTRAFLNIYIQ